MLRTFGMLVLIMTLQGVQTIQAQTATDLATGARVRVTAADGRARLATFTRMTADSIDFVDLARNANTRMAISQLSKLELSRGDKSRAGARRGAWIGLAVGTLAGAALGVVSYEEPQCKSGEFCYDEPSCSPVCTKRSSITVNAAVGAASGIYLGFRFGKRKGREKWTEIDLHAR